MSRYEHGTATLGESKLVGMIEDHETGHYSIVIDHEDTDMFLSIGPEWNVVFDADHVSHSSEIGDHND